VTLKLKGAKIRADIGPEITLLMDTATGSTVTLRHSQKTALVLSGSAARQLLEKEKQLQPAAPAPTPRPTGQTATINGRETRAYTNGHVTWWVAERLPADPLGEMLDALRKTYAVQLADGIPCLSGEASLPGVPLRTEWTTPENKKIITTVISAQEKPLEAVDFAVPPGYRRVTSPVF